MGRITTLSRVSFIALGAASLAACGGGGGGGGVVTTPPPVGGTPTPTPGGTPTPTPGGTPTPTPGGTPTGANDDLFQPLASESFVNDAVGSAARVGNSGSFDILWVEKSNLTISYSASDNSYTVATARDSGRFLPADIIYEDTAQWVFESINGNTTDRLLLTKPGSSGSFTYRYVGGATWEHNETDSTGVTGSVHAFTYGVPTPAASLPVTGRGFFDIDVLASDADISYVGQGEAVIDFGSGRLDFIAPLDRVLSDGSVFEDYADFIATAALGSGNSFSGSFEFWPNITGELDGRLYGPGADEIGATFIGTDASLGRPFGGFVVGRRQDLQTLADFSGLIDNGSFSASRLVRYSESGLGSVDSYDDTDFRNFAHYDGSTSQYEVNVGGYTYGFGPSDFVGSDGRFAEFVDSDGISYRVFETGPGNPDIELTYASFVWMNSVEVDGSVLVDDNHFIEFGLRSDMSPQTGEATYSGRLYGVAVSDERVFDLTGTTSFAIDFADTSLTGQFRPTAQNRADGMSYAVSPIDLTGSLNGVWIQAHGNAFSFHVDGQLYGPLGEEIAGIFNGHIGDDPVNTGISMFGSGAFVGTRD
ncbi:transferrin-binding protein-like solute binding protein [Alteraurantiacibacter aquimixticola]|uniref:Transferrin-binding protein B C-lobe/N-lobe beta-barrel domain-containing protein n=1 Tax=Alteraurantiacibacter aquimixticola TaxID=2489173 RepID=A0A4T3F018_9SPHN|nr:transferrin-binding protein-like solute binding protein [Alteraurantiacibacter aquimixticola]TIX50391.1 hypothetical protein E5222_08940 [Alteraurantiacibacter aquimixticola]